MSRRSLGHIRQRGDCWIAQVTIPGSGGRHRTEVIHGSEREAEKALQRLLREVEAQPAARGRLTFGAYLTDRWLPHVAGKAGSKGKSPRTAAEYESKVRCYVLSTPLAKTELKKLTPEMLDRWMGHLRRSRPDLSERTLHHAYSVVRASLRQAKRWRLIPEDPSEAMDDVPEPRGYDAHMVTAAEARSVLEGCAGRRLGVGHALVLGAGLRPCEACGLRWERDVDLEGGRVRPRFDVVPARGMGLIEVQTKTEKSARWVPLPAWAVQLLRDHRRQQLEERLAAVTWIDEDLVITNASGGLLRPSYLSRDFQQLRSELGLPAFRLYDLRHATAQLMLGAGVDLHTVSKQMRHSRISTTSEFYLGQDEALGRAAAGVLDQILGPSKL